jgi:hypothetical protein
MDDAIAASFCDAVAVPNNLFQRGGLVAPSLAGHPAL